MKKFILLFALVLLLFTFMTACGTASNPSSDTDNKKTSEVTKKEAPLKNVQITLNAPEESQPKDMLENVSKIYMDKNPNIKIQVETFSGIPQIEYYKTKLASGALPDIFFINTPDPAFVNAGALMELPQDIIDAAPDTKLNQYKGKYYQVVNNKQLDGIFYNKKIFSDLGIQVPKNQAEFIAACDKILTVKITPIITGFKDAWVGDLFLQGSMLSTDVFLKNHDWEIQRLQGKVKYNSPEVIKTYKKFQDYIKKGYMGKGLMSITYDQCKEMFATGKGAMFPMGNWFIGDLVQLKPEFEVGWFPYPTEDGTPGYLKGLGTSFVMSSSTKNPQEVIAFYKWLTTDPEALAPQYDRLQVVPDVKANVDFNAAPLLKEIIQSTNNIDNSAIWSFSQTGDNVSPPGAYDFNVKISQEIAAGSNIEKALQKLDAEYDRLLKAK
jgi:ABC-type glycerol-3-phosphate transport system substrate-binding protein